jgi:hypothetical protein
MSRLISFSLIWYPSNMYSILQNAEPQSLTPGASNQTFQYPVLKHPPSVFLPWVKNQVSHPYRKQVKLYVGFEVLTAMRTKMAVFWVVAPWGRVSVYRRFRRPHSSLWWWRQLRTSVTLVNWNPSSRRCNPGESNHSKIVVFYVKVFPFLDIREDRSWLHGDNHSQGVLCLEFLREWNFIWYRCSNRLDVVTFSEHILVTLVL